MYFNSKLFTILLLFLYFSIVECKKSFTILLDSTESMRNEISIIKRSMTSIAKEIGSWNEIENYILLSFSDPGKYLYFFLNLNMNMKIDTKTFVPITDHIKTFERPLMLRTL